MIRQEQAAANILEDTSPQAPTVFIETYGCQMNVLDSELVLDQLDLLGYKQVPTPQQADVVLLNTCSVRELSEQKVWSQLGRLGLLKQHRPSMIIGVLGCMAEREGVGILKRVPHVDVLCGPSELSELPALIDNVRVTQQAQTALSGHTSRRTATLDKSQERLDNLDLSRAFSPEQVKHQAYVRITRGCNKFCSFCVVPYTRGPEVHRPVVQIIDEIKRLVEQGVLEVTLLGQTINHYHSTHAGDDANFAQLLWRIHEAVPDLPRLRFLTSYPRDFTDEALDVMAAAERICPFLHIPVQSGANHLLRAMNRGYTVEQYFNLIDRARARMPDIRITGDMIVGFPGETDEDHQASIRLLQQVRYKSCFVFKYSPRPGTVAARRLVDDVPEEVKKSRNQELLQVQADISLQHHAQLVGQTLNVLVERYTPLRPAKAAPQEVQVGWQRRHAVTDTSLVRLAGRTSGDEVVAFNGPKELVGKQVQVLGKTALPLTVLGEWVDVSCEPELKIKHPVSI